MNIEKQEIRQAISTDLEKVVELHLQAFPGFLMSLLGRRFLSVYYRTVFEYARGIFIVAVSADQKIVGFAAGFIESKRFYSFLNQRKRSMMLAAAIHVALRPHIWLRVVENMRAIGVGGLKSTANDGVVAELCSIGVSPSMSGSGYGTKLVEAFISQCRASGASVVTLTTDADNNDVVNRFYKRLGFVATDTLERASGRRMNLFSRTL